MPPAPTQNAKLQRRKFKKITVLNLERHVFYFRSTKDSFLVCLDPVIIEVAGKLSTEVQRWGKAVTLEKHYDKWSTWSAGWGFFIRVFTINSIPSGQLLSFLCPFTMRFREHSANKPHLKFLSNCSVMTRLSPPVFAEPRGGYVAAPQSIPDTGASSCCCMSRSSSTGVASRCHGGGGGVPREQLSSGLTLFWRGQKHISLPLEKPSLNLVQLEWVEPSPGQVGLCLTTSIW